MLQGQQRTKGARREEIDKLPVGTIPRSTDTSKFFSPTAVLVEHGIQMAESPGGRRTRHYLCVNNLR